MKAICSGVERNLAWFCVRSQPKHEHVAAGNLRRHAGIEVLNPRIRFKRATVRGPIWVTEAVFPNYLFACFDWTLSLRDVQHTFGVSGVVHFGRFWPTIPDESIEDLRGLIGDEEIRVIDQNLRPGDEVEVAGGAFHGFRGVISRLMPGRQRVAVLLDFLGRQTLVEVTVDAVNRTFVNPVATRI